MVKEVESRMSLAEFRIELESHPVTLVDFFAEWCGPCKQIAPVVEQLSKQNPNVTFLKVNVDECQELSQSLGVTAMPTFVLFARAKEITRLAGANPAKLKEILQKASSYAASAPLADGTRVTIHGLQNAAQHNGKAGRVVSFDSGAGRYTVQLPAPKGEATEPVTIAVRPANLSQVLTVELTGASDNVEYNGQSGITMGYDSEKERYTVQLKNGDTVSVKRESVIVPVHTSVLIMGLTGAAQHNGKWATVVSVDREARRYEVRLLAPDSAQQPHLRVKWENVRV
eukprot:RCo043028